MPDVLALLTRVEARAPQRTPEPETPERGAEGRFDDAFDRAAPQSGAADTAREARRDDPPADKPKPVKSGERTKAAEAAGTGVSQADSVAGDLASLLSAPHVDSEAVAAASPVEEKTVAGDAIEPADSEVALGDAVIPVESVLLNAVAAATVVGPAQASTSELEAAPSSVSDFDPISASAPLLKGATPNATPQTDTAGTKVQAAQELVVPGNDAKPDAVSQEPAAPASAPAPESALNSTVAISEAPSPSPHKLKAKHENLGAGLDLRFEPGTAPDRPRPLLHAVEPSRSAAAAQLIGGADAAAQVVAAIRADAGADQIDVRLDPPELGKVRIAMHIDRSDVVTATVSSERPDTLDLLRRHQDELARELERAGFAKVRLDFSTEAGGQGFAQQPQTTAAAATGGRNEPIEEARIHYLSLRTDNRLDRVV